MSAKLKCVLNTHLGVFGFICKEFCNQDSVCGTTLSFCMVS